jgi:hypothetical protein
MTIIYCITAAVNIPANRDIDGFAIKNTGD